MATDNFETELETLINRYSLENESDTPDFIVAQYIAGCLKVFAEAAKARDKWYGFEPWAGNQVTDAILPTNNTQEKQK